LLGQSRLAQALHNPGRRQLFRGWGAWFTVGKRGMRTTLGLPRERAIVDGRDSWKIVLWVLIALSLIGWLASGAHAETVTCSASFQGYRICQGTKRLPLHGMGERWQAVR
jgi:hypothetical protein